jgi:hypothetical protein
VLIGAIRKLAEAIRATCAFEGGPVVDEAELKVNGDGAR